MKIGELAQATGTQEGTIRYYEREGLLPQPARTSSNYRVYGPEHVERLEFIRQCRNLDMALNEIQVLLRSKDAPQDDCSAVNALLEAHIGHVDQRIRELRVLQKRLRELRQRCNRAQPAGDCGILNSLAQANSPAPKPRPRPHSALADVHKRARE
ncbi:MULTISPECIES: Cd(II)/Pb(II)-responsive transcriptional regulator [Azohydromonas]|jgi:Cd(II)/Pb(II)-responsive transcriptional regulator|uniref:Cd(II)/Pb(II)-responsive transcriptional regulator n=1 Tax=Azohydromonas lata TaxID=45677 RepID=A0ABU5I9B5_9BURK|nr:MULTISPECIES: Cd(II)/Pb(II)-responsive transcriptional regulator [Azohydromonas]MDZ5455689.1 Cd(II)/Pb(II)-responsive transcriptional regulator [Azohydromonas lata]